MNKALIFALFSLCACSHLPDWMGAGNDDVPLSGERISVIDSGINLKPDASQAAEKIELTDAKFNFENYKEFPVGEAAQDNYALTNAPVIANGKIFVIDGIGNVSAFKQSSLEKIWQHNAGNPENEDDDNLPGGGIAFANNIIFASQGNGEVVAISAEKGTEIWKRALGTPIRKSPAVADDKVFVATSDNQLFALNIADGSTIWRHSGSMESTTNYGSPTPAVKNDIVVIAYSSGEVFGLNTTRGIEQWSENITAGSAQRKTSATFVDVSAAPLMIDGITYIGSQSGTLTAFNSNNGTKVWEQKIGSIEFTPTAAGNFIFAIGADSNLVALNRFTGNIKWAATLPPKENKKDTEKWAGPALAGGSIIAVSSKGKLAVYDAASGSLTGVKDATPDVFSSPVISGNNLYLLNNSAQLAVY